MTGVETCELAGMRMHGAVAAGFRTCMVLLCRGMCIVLLSCLLAEAQGMLSLRTRMCCMVLVLGISGWGFDPFFVVVGCVL
jgi:hypothetical protein